MGAAGVLMSTLAFAATWKFFSSATQASMASGGDLAGIYSMVFVTVPNMDTAKKLSGYY